VEAVNFHLFGEMLLGKKLKALNGKLTLPKLSPPSKSKLLSFEFIIVLRRTLIIKRILFYFIWYKEKRAHHSLSFFLIDFISVSVEPLLNYFV